MSFLLIACSQIAMPKSHAAAYHARFDTQVMQQIKPHMMEYAAESVFMYTAYSRGGCRHAPYTPICASGPNGSTLHYGHAASPNGICPSLLRFVFCTLSLCDAA